MERPFKSATSGFFWDEDVWARGRRKIFLEDPKKKDNCYESVNLRIGQLKRTDCLKRQSDKERETAL